MVTKIKQIFKQAVLRFWSLRVPLIVVCILLAALLCTAQYLNIFFSFIHNPAPH